MHKSGPVANASEFVSVLDRCWKPMLIFSGIIWVINMIVFGPLSLWLLDELARYGDVIVGNYSIHRWLLSPRGLLWLLLTGTLAILSWLIYAAGLFWIANSADATDLKGLIRLLRSNSSRWVGLFHLSLRLFCIFVPLALLALVGAGLAHFLFLRDYDINFYMTRKPPEWWYALSLAGVWAGAGAVLILRVSMRLMFVFPCWLEEGCSYRDAFRRSMALTKNRFWGLFCLSIAGIATWWVLARLVDQVLFFIAGHLIQMLGGALEQTVLVISGYLVLVVVTDGLLLFLGVAWAVANVTHSYRRACPEVEGASLGRPPIEREAQPRGRVGRPMVLAGLVVLAFSSLAVTMVILGRDAPEKLPIVIAHRAGPLDAPENSLSALKRVISDGVSHAAEIDVQLSADGVVVVAHDTDLMKVAGDRRVIAQTRFSDLSDVDIGKKFSSDFAGERLATLEQFLDVAAGKVTLYIEFKYSAGSKLVDKTIALVRAKQMQDEVVLISLELADVRRVQALAPEIEVGYFASVRVGDLRRLDVSCIGLNQSLATRRFVRSLQAHDLTVHAWTINSADRMLELIELGIDGLITDQPRLADEVIKDFDALPPAAKVLLQFRRFWGHLDKAQRSVTPKAD